MSDTRTEREDKILGNDKLLMDPGIIMKLKLSILFQINTQIRNSFHCSMGGF